MVWYGRCTLFSSYGGLLVLWAKLLIALGSALVFAMLLAAAVRRRSNENRGARILASVLGLFFLLFFVTWADDLWSLPSRIASGWSERAIPFALVSAALGLLVVVLSALVRDRSARARRH
jgi:hypothetical protein